MIILQREPRDCHNAAIGTACGVSYEKVCEATGHKDLPGPLESPVFSNPWNLYLALIRLGFWRKIITWGDLKAGRAKPGKTIVLVKKSLTQQHWVVWGGVQVSAGHVVYHRIYWGDSVNVRLVPENEFKKMFLRKILGDKRLIICAFEVYRISFWELIRKCFKSLFSI
jgi:hypothetical protein